MTASATRSGIARSRKNGVPPQLAEAGRAISSSSRASSEKTMRPTPPRRCGWRDCGLGRRARAPRAGGRWTRRRRGTRRRARARASTAASRARLSRREKSSGSSMGGVRVGRASASLRARAPRRRSRRSRGRCGKSSQRGSGVERDAGARELGRRVALRELRVRGEERVDDRARSPRAARCRSRRRGGRRASPASRRRRGSRLLRGELGDGGFRLPPLEVGIAAQRAEAGARRVDQHAVDLAGEALDLARRARARSPADARSTGPSARAAA